MHDEKGNVDVKKAEALSKKGRMEGELKILTERLKEVEGQGRQFLQEVVGLKRRISERQNTIADLDQILQGP